MFLFKSNKILTNSELIAEQLRQARKEKNLKLSEAAQKLNINYKYLKALESGEYNKLPQGVYGKSFLREYALFLGLNYNELAAAFTEENNMPEKKEQQELFSKRRVKKSYFFAIPKFIKGAVILILATSLFIYLGFSLRQALSPPVLYIYNPGESLVILEKKIIVSGKTESEAQIIINGKKILSNTTGEFSETINLKEGINNIAITARKKYGRDNTIIRQVLVKVNGNN